VCGESDVVCMGGGGGVGELWCGVCWCGWGVGVMIGIWMMQSGVCEVCGVCIEGGGEYGG